MVFATRKLFKVTVPTVGCGVFFTDCHNTENTVHVNKYKNTFNY